jgi:antirestriction protein ArdC
MICAELGISDCDFTNGAAYVGNWVSKLRDDKKELFRAAADAKRIADFLLAFHLDFAARSAPLEEHLRDTPPGEQENELKAAA